MLTQSQADRLISELKEAARKDIFLWQKNRRDDELIVSVTDSKLQFIVSLSRNPFEIRLHARTKDQNIGLLRIDNVPYHSNPDGTEIRNQPHMHVYRAGEELNWAEPIDWYDLGDPVKTLGKFLDIFHTRFPQGVTLDMY